MNLTKDMDHRQSECVCMYTSKGCSQHLTDLLFHMNPNWKCLVTEVCIRMGLNRFKGCYKPLTDHLFHMNPNWKCLVTEV